MFGWLKRLMTPRSNAQQVLEAYAKGQGAGESLRRSIDAYLEVRGREFSNAFLPILQKRLGAFLAVEDSSPELAAQQQWLEYLREVGETEAQLMDEVPSQLVEVFNAADVLGVRQQIDQYLAQQVQTSCQLAGLHGALLVVSDLEAALRARGRPLLNLPSDGDAGELRGLQSAYAMARLASTAARTAVAEYLEGRLVPLEERYLDVFRQRLGTIHDSPPHPPRLVAEAELKIFHNQLHDLPGKLRLELQEHLTDWYTLADEGDFRSTVDDLVEERLAKTLASLEAESDGMFHAALSRTVS